MSSAESRSPASPRPNQDGEKISKFSIGKDSGMSIEQAKAKLSFADKNMGKVYAQWRERIKSQLVAMGISGSKDAGSVRWSDLLDFARKQSAVAHVLDELTEEIRTDDGIVQR